MRGKICPEFDDDVNIGPLDEHDRTAEEKLEAAMDFYCAAEVGIAIRTMRLDPGKGGFAPWPGGWVGMVRDLVLQ